MYDLILKNAICVLYKDNKLFEEQVDIAVQNKKIVEIGNHLTTEAKQKLDLKNCHLLPGLIDTQVHFREPGLTHKEDFYSGSLGAVRGGITGVFDMPNTSPPLIDKKSFDDKMQLIRNRSWCNYALFVGACPQNLEALKELENLPSCCGVKIFMGASTGNLLLSKDEDILTALQNGKRRVAIHCEDEERLQQRWPQYKNKNSAAFHPQWRDELSSLKATQRVLSLAKKTKRPVHLLHITTKEEMELLKKNKDVCSVECTPQHLSLSAPECYDKLGAFAQMNPPIRTKDHTEKLWKALQEGVVDILGSDHAPHTKKEKNKGWPKSPSGLTGVQTTVPLMLNWINKGKLTLCRLVELMALNPSKLYKIKNKGRLEVGGDADFTVVDLKKQKTIEDSWIDSRSKWTAFHGTKVQGWPVMTIINGQIVMRDDEVLGKPNGQPMSFNI